MTPRQSLLIGATGVALLFAGLGAYAQISTSSQSQPMTPTDVQALIPPFSDTVPPSEMVGGSTGSTATIRRGDAANPRITRSTTVVTGAGGTFSGTWSTPLSSATPVLVLTPIAASSSIDCQLTSAPNATTFAGRCWTAQTTLLNLSIITAGLTLNPMTTTAAGVSIQVIAIPSSQ